MQCNAMQMHNRKYNKCKMKSTMKNTNADEVLFNEVLDTFSAMGIQMDPWTMEKYKGLSDALQRNGKLTESQRNLLSSLPLKAKQYIANAPAKKPRYKKEEPKETISMANLLSPQERFGGNYKKELADWIYEFESKMLTSWIPSKDEIFQYGRFLRLLGKPYSAPAKWRMEFEEFVNS